METRKRKIIDLKKINQKENSTKNRKAHNKKRTKNKRGIWGST